jgi:hypothetical protein
VLCDLFQRLAKERESWQRRLISPKRRDFNTLRAQ